MAIERIESRVDPLNPNRIQRTKHDVIPPVHVLLRTRRADPNSKDESPVPETAIDIIDAETIDYIRYEEDGVFRETLVGEVINHYADNLTIGDNYKGKVVYRYRSDHLEQELEEK